MATLANRPEKVKTKQPERKCHLSAGTGGSRRILALYIGPRAFLYWFQRIHSDWGEAFELEKWEDGETYHINLNPVSCDCKGFLKWHHCKHIESLEALKKAGQF
jgi:hypothetical protein